MNTGHTVGSNTGIGSRLTTSTGIPYDNNQHVLTAGARGPILLQDFPFLNKI